MREEISTLFEGLDGRISKLSEVYNEFIRSTKTIKTPDMKAFIFSLDSFYFQNSLLKRENQYLREYYPSKHPLGPNSLRLLSVSFRLSTSLPT